MIYPPFTAPPRRTPSPTSDFTLCRMPVIHKRQSYPWSVHRSVDKFIATISRPDVHNKVRHVQFPFATDREARKFCKVYAPPKPDTVSTCCLLCNASASETTSNSHSPMSMSPLSYSSSHTSTVHLRNCRNCGAAVCEQCTARWGLRMIPKTYYTTSGSSLPLTVRVCRSCDWLSNAFCMALLQGRYEDVLRLYETGNLNLRNCFANISREVFFPIHCATLGGSLDLVRWLVDKQLCPVSVQRNSRGQMLSVQTSASRTLLDLAMAGKPKIEILRFLLQKGLSITDVKDPTLASKTLEVTLRNGGIHPPTPMTSLETSVAVVEGLENDDSATAATMDDPCALCYERQMNCVLVPCGHQICCSECGKQVSTCPVCKVECTVLRVFRQ